MKTQETPEARLLKSRRLALGYSQQYVAEAVGIQLRQYQRLEYGEILMSRMYMRTGLRICRVLQIDPYELVFAGEPVLYIYE